MRTAVPALGLAFLLLSCREVSLDEREFAFCRELSEKECIPPLLTARAVFHFANPKATGSLKDYFDSIYFAGDTLAFHLKFARSLKKEESDFWADHFRASYSFEGQEQQFAMERVDVREGAITGFSLVGSILEKYYQHELKEPFRQIEPVTVTYSFWLNDEKLGSRSISLSVINDFGAEFQ